MDILDALRAGLADRGRVVVAYSGGVDSAFLADVADEALGPDAIAVTAVSPSLAPRERRAAAELAAARGWRHREVRTDEHTRPGYIANATDRCYFCKDALFDVLEAIAATEAGVVCVGTNLDDLGTHRPGLRAVAEHGVAQPLVEAGFSKQDVRDRAAERGLPVATKPATPCLASRVAYGIAVTPERLDRIARAEEVVWSLGVSDVRVRDLGDRARIEVPVDELDLVGTSTAVDELLRLGFTDVVLDRRGLRSGSMLGLVDAPTAGTTGPRQATGADPPEARSGPDVG